MPAVRYPDRRAFLFLPQKRTVMTQPATPLDPSASTQTAELSPHAAVQRCCTAYRHAIEAGGGPKVSSARDAAQEAYKAALPFLSTRASIRGFIACIAQGMVFGIFFFDEGPKLIAAAKAALSALPPEAAPMAPHSARPAGRPRTSDPVHDHNPSQNPLPEN
jgi:hypothetical protein